jgi:hypothetical protein
MKTIMKRFLAGTALLALTGAMNGCSPVMVASRPRPVIYDPAPVPVAVAPVVQPVPVVPVAPVVAVVPVVPVWAPPYTFVHEVHYYYFPDYMVYYDVFASNYLYFNGYSWIQVTVLPALPAYYGFNPALAYIVVLNRNTYQPWTHHAHYHETYPAHYYQTAYRPRTATGSNVMLRAYDENRDRAVYVDKKTNREVSVAYESTHVRTSTGTTAVSAESPMRRSEPVQAVVKQERTVETVKPVQSESARRQESATSVKGSGRRELPARTVTPTTDTRDNHRTLTPPVKTQADRQRTQTGQEGRAVIQYDKNRNVPAPATEARATGRTESRVQPAVRSERSITPSATPSKSQAAEATKAAAGEHNRSDARTGSTRSEATGKSSAGDNRKSR